MKYRALIVALLAFCMSALVACSSAPADTTVATTELLTYDEIRGTGLANNCPSLAETSRGSIPIEAGATYKLTGLCLQPTTYFVKEEPANKRQERNLCLVNC
jgi:photosystem II oxygen-evolving enhancer protein 1